MEDKENRRLSFLTKKRHQEKKKEGEFTLMLKETRSKVMKEREPKVTAVFQESKQVLGSISIKLLDFCKEQMLYASRKGCSSISIVLPPRSPKEQLEDGFPGLEEIMKKHKITLNKEEKMILIRSLVTRLIHLVEKEKELKGIQFSIQPEETRRPLTLGINKTITIIRAAFSWQ